MVIVPKTKEARFRVEGERVLVIVDGRTVLDLPWDAAKQSALALGQCALKAEGHAKAEGIAYDQAILLRAGVPIGLTNNPRIQAEAAKEAAWNTNLRRYMPGGVKSEEQVGTPAVQALPISPKRCA